MTGGIVEPVQTVQEFTLLTRVHEKIEPADCAFHLHQVDEEAVDRVRRDEFRHESGVLSVEEVQNVEDSL